MLFVQYGKNLKMLMDDGRTGAGRVNILKANDLFEEALFEETF